MNQQYRIKEKNGRFYPQEKCFLFWNYFYESWYIVYPEVSKSFDLTEMWCKTKEDAQTYIDKKKKETTVIYHKA